MVTFLLLFFISISCSIFQPVSPSDIGEEEHTHQELLAYVTNNYTDTAFKPFNEEFMREKLERYPFLLIKLIPQPSYASHFKRCLLDEAASHFKPNILAYLLDLLTPEQKNILDSRSSSEWNPTWIFLNDSDGSYSEFKSYNEEEREIREEKTLQVLIEKGFAAPLKEEGDSTFWDKAAEKNRIIPIKKFITYPCIQEEHILSAFKKAVEYNSDIVLSFLLKNQTIQSLSEEKYEAFCEAFTNGKAYRNGEMTLSLLLDHAPHQKALLTRMFFRFILDNKVNLITPLIRYSITHDKKFSMYTLHTACLMAVNSSYQHIFCTIFEEVSSSQIIPLILEIIKKLAQCNDTFSLKMVIHLLKNNYNFSLAVSNKLQKHIQSVETDTDYNEDLYTFLQNMYSQPNADQQYLRYLLLENKATLLSNASPEFIEALQDFFNDSLLTEE